MSCLAGFAWKWADLDERVVTKSLHSPYCVVCFYPEIQFHPQVSLKLLNDPVEVKPVEKVWDQDIGNKLKSPQIGCNRRADSRMLYFDRYWFFSMPKYRMVYLGIGEDSPVFRA